jgi:hypothetical protein
MNWYELRLGVNVLCAATGWRVARLSAGLGAMGTTIVGHSVRCSMRRSYTACQLPTCKATLVRYNYLSVLVARRKAETLTVTMSMPRIIVCVQP